jgi:hypothetical protein
MKIIIIIITAATIIAFLCSCTSNNDNNTTEQTANNTSNISNFTKSFEGTINNKFGIIMTLTKNAKSLNGTYTYKNKGIPIKISGSIDDNGNLTINEFNDNVSMTGVFKGQLSGENIIGNWEKPDGSKIIPFSITESVNTETSIVKSTKNNSDDDSNWTGTYVDKFGSTLKLKGPSSDGALKFKLIQASANCIGLVEGIAYLTKTGVANFDAEDDNCHLNFTFNPGSIQVSEYDCENYRGASCGTFDGWYNKK